MAVARCAPGLAASVPRPHTRQSSESVARPQPDPSKTPGPGGYRDDSARLCQAYRGRKNRPAHFSAPRGGENSPAEGGALSRPSRQKDKLAEALRERLEAKTFAQLAAA